MKLFLNNDEADPSFPLASSQQGGKKFHFKNGLKLLLQEDRRIPLVCFFLKIDETGSINEKKYLGSGISHFVEHAIFLGSKKFPQKDAFSNYLESKGASDFNAYTTYDHTAYYFSFFREHFSKVIHAFYDFIFNPLFPGDEVENERGTILSEMDMIYDRPNDFFYQCLEYYLENSNAYKYPIIGIKKIFSQITPRDLKAFHAEKYRLENMTLSIVGNVNEAEALKEVNDAFFKKHSLKKHSLSESLKKSFPRPRHWEFKATPFEPQKSVEATHQQVVFPKLCLVFPAANFFQPERYAGEIFSYLVGRGKGSLFHQELLEKKKLVEAISTVYSFDKNKGFIYINVTLKKHANNERLRKTIGKVLGEIKAIFKKIDLFLHDALLEGAKMAFMNEIFKERESFMELAYGNLYSFEHVGDLTYRETYLKAVKQLSRNDLVTMVAKFFLKDNYQLFLLLPKKNFAQGKVFSKSKRMKNLSMLENKLLKTLAKDKRVPTKKITTPLNPSKSEKFEGINEVNEKPKIVKKQFASGMKLIFAREQFNPLVNVILKVRGGQHFESLTAANEVQFPSGVFQLLTKMLFTSNKKYSKKKMVSLFRENALDFFSHVGENSLTLGFTCEQGKYSLAMEVMQSMLLNEEFSLQEFRFEKKNQLFEIARNQERLENLALLAFKKKFFKNVVYAAPQSGTKNSVGKITLDHLNKLLLNLKREKKAWAMTAPWQANAPQTLEAENWLAKLGHESALKNKKIVIPKLVHHGHKSIHFSHVKDIRETHIHMGYFAPPKFSSDEMAFKIIENYLSGLGGPIFKLRSEGYEKNGKKMGGRAYSLGVYYKASLDYGAFIFYGSLGELSKGEYGWLVDAFRKEIHEITKRSIPQEEIQRAKTILSNQFYKSSLRQKYKTELYSSLELHGKSQGQRERDFQRMMKMEPDEIQKAAKRYFREDNFLVHVMIGR